MTYQVLARKWRPKNFDELTGQTEVLAALIHSLNNQRLHHAYLFTGTRGVGKTTIARIIAKCFNCAQGVSAKPCDQCQNCLEIKEGRFVDLIEIDAASRTKVEDTREILDNIQYAPSQGRFKVYLIDEVHMLSTHSFNALLKTLEEPPAHVKFLLATTDPQKLPITVLSRCLQFHLKNIPHEAIFERLQFILNAEKINFDVAALKLISKSAAGSLRDALSLLDQAINQGNGEVILENTRKMLGSAPSDLLYQIAHLLVTKNLGELFQTAEALGKELIDYQELTDFFLELWYEVSLKQQIPSVKTSTHPQEILEELAQILTPTETQLFYQICLHGKRDLALAPSPFLGFKMLLLRLSSFYPVTTETSDTKSVHEKSHKSASKIAMLATPASTSAEPIKPQTTSPAKKLEALNWAELINLLPLTGMVKQLARHLCFQEQQGHTLKFSLNREHQASLNARLQKELNTILNHYFDTEITLQIDLINNSLNTPAAIEHQETQAKKTALQQKVYSDSNLDFLKNNFNAIITDIKSLK
jgi:DNA polymerase-3 subunit gamma/tau